MRTIKLTKLEIYGYMSISAEIPVDIVIKNINYMLEWKLKGFDDKDGKNLPIELNVTTIKMKGDTSLYVKETIEEIKKKLKRKKNDRNKL